jgi:Short C-terminal domain
MTHAEELERLSELHRNGDLSDDEFATEKARLIEQAYQEVKPIHSQPQATLAGSSPMKKGFFGCLGIIALLLLYFVFGPSPSDNRSSDASTAKDEPNPSQAPTPSTPPVYGPKLELQNYRWGKTDGGGYAELTGSVKNISNEKLENIDVVGLFKDKSGELITSDDAVIDYNPILPGQTSPFKVMVTWNPAMRTAEVDFKELMGGTISWRVRESNIRPPKPAAADTHGDLPQPKF